MKELAPIASKWQNRDLDSSSLAPEFVLLATILDLALEMIRKDLVESVIEISPVMKGPILVEPNSTWVFVYFVVSSTSVLPALSSVGVSSIRKRVLQGKALQRRKDL